MSRTGVALVIVAAGRGERLGAGVPKAFVRLGGREMVLRTLRRCADVGLFDEAVVAVPGDRVESFHALVAAQGPWPFPVRGVPGGAYRQTSVLSALKAVAADEGIVVVHDAARPFASAGLFVRCIERAKECGAAVAAVRVPDTLKRVADGEIVATVDRRGLYMAQTPQAFGLQLLREAHRRAAQSGYRGTDDAALVEWNGGRVEIVEGEPDNVKVTEPADLRHAERRLEAEPDG